MSAPSRVMQLVKISINSYLLDIKNLQKRPWAEYDVVFCIITSRRGKDQMLFLDRIGGPVL